VSEAYKSKAYLSLLIHREHGLYNFADENNKDRLRVPEVMDGTGLSSIATEEDSTICGTYINIRVTYQFPRHFGRK